MKPEWFGPITAHAKEWTDVYLGDVLLRGSLLMIVLLFVFMSGSGLLNLWRGKYPRYDTAPYQRVDDIAGAFLFAAAATVAAAALWRLS